MKFFAEKTMMETWSKALSAMAEVGMLSHQSRNIERVVLLTGMLSPCNHSLLLHLWYKAEFASTHVSCMLPGQPMLKSANKSLWSTTACTMTE